MVYNPDGQRLSVTQEVALLLACIVVAVGITFAFAWRDNGNQIQRTKAAEQAQEQESGAPALQLHPTVRAVA